jgi:hypothetical protein
MIRQATGSFLIPAKSKKPETARFMDFKIPKPKILFGHFSLDDHLIRLEINEKH